MRSLLRIVARWVDETRREEWTREWEAELAEADRCDRSRLRILLWAVEDATRHGVRAATHAAAAHELRFAVRRLRRAPLYSLSVIATLALGIGANAAIFSVVDRYLVRPLDLQEPERVVVLNKEKAGRLGFTSAPNYLDWRERSTSFDDLAAVQAGSATLSGLDTPRRESLARVHPGFFRLMGVTLLMGRGFDDAEGSPGRDRVAILSHDLWVDALGADPRAVGTSITLNGDTYAVVGVLPAALRLPGFSARVYTPLSFDEETLGVRGRNNLSVVGRLAPGIPLSRAEAEMDGIGRRLAAEYPEANDGWTITVRPLQDALVAGTARPLWILLGASALVLLLACVNVASLVVVRGLTRDRELAVRVSLGAARSRLTVQLLLETVLLSAVGGLAGVALAGLLIDPIRALIPSQLASLGEVGVDGRILLFGLVASIATGLVAGLTPAMRLSRRAYEGSSGGAGVGGILRSRFTSRRGNVALVATQFALATVLLFGAGLMARSLSALYAVDTGLRADGLSSFRVMLPSASYPEPVLVADALDQMLDGLGREVPRAAAVSHLPLSGANLTSSILIQGRPEDMSTNGPSAGIRVVTPGYFDVAGIPVVSGRGFSSYDSEGSEPVALINQRAADLYWPGEDPVGQWVAYAQDADGTFIRRRIVGVVGDALFAGPSRPAVPEVYQTHRQTRDVWRWFGRSMTFVVGTRDGSTLPLSVAQAAVSSVDPDVPVVGLSSLDDVFRSSIGTPRFYGTLISSFAVLALLLASIGLYGVIAFQVRLRWHELGVRRALGAGGGAIIRNVLSTSLGAAALGTGLGLGLAALMGGLLDDMVFGVGVRDPLTMLGAVTVLLPVVLLAAWGPARRAAAVNPVETLGTE